MILLGLLFGSAVWYARQPSAMELGRRASELAAQSRTALSRGDADRAAELTQQAVALARTAVARDPKCAAALVVLGDAAAARQDAAEALQHFDAIPPSARREWLYALEITGDLQISQGRLADAAVRFRRILEVDPRQTTALHRLAALLAMSGQHQEAAAPLLQLVRQGEHTLEELSLLGCLGELHDDDDLVDRLLGRAPDDPWLLLGVAGRELYNHDPARALPRLREVIAREPNLWEAHLQWGEALLETGRLSELRGWHAALPTEAERIAGFWRLQGKYAQQSGQAEAAIRCFWEAARRDPNDWSAHAILAQLLAACDDPRGAQFLERAERLRELVDTLLEILRAQPKMELVLNAGRLCDVLGRRWEAWAWYAQGADQRSSQPVAVAERDRLWPLLDDSLPQTIPEGLPADQVDFSALPLPRWPTAAQTDQGAAAAPRVPVRFADVAASLGLHFQYFNGHDASESGMGIWQSVGGGVAALDYDGDGWCDLHFSQGGEWPPRTGPTEFVDRLFRNAGGMAFQDVTALAGVGDPGFSHGATVGDYDGDGFSDLFVSNLGENRLYRNQGDGTFVDVTEPAGLGGALWSTSCVFVDLDGDGLPELYETTYLAGRRPFTELCRDEQLQAFRSCTPVGFEAEQDRLFWNRGDGRFEDISARAGILAEGGKGLGIASFILEGDRLPSLYIGNDTRPNFLFVNVTEPGESPPRFEERGVLAGCAYDIHGRSQASMGIAVDDADGDGLCDLAVTGFFHEYTILYVQQSGRMFADMASQAGLKEPSVAMLGFGTQFLDAELDGWPDLVVANGHVDDYTGKGIPFRMRAQYFSNLGGGKFSERSAEEMGEYFKHEQLGRGLARLDWNRDGREDFVVSHLDTPAALVTNVTERTGHFLALTFRGVVSARDAIGVRVQVTAGGRQWTKQLTAGDGFCVSNQRQLVFGLGEADAVDELRVQWPAGGVQTWQGIPADRELLVIEGRSEPVPLAR
ncbi:MAG: FG-GAP-like repeat-containing protein [Planctomycetales bacterium]